MATPVKDALLPNDGDVVHVLIGQHMRIRDLFAAVEMATGDARREAFGRLVTLLAVHETAEEQIVHPAARSAIENGDVVADALLAEEHVAKEKLSDLEKLDPEGPEFMAGLLELREDVLAHAYHEETNEFRYLRRAHDPARLKALAKAVLAAEKVAPTHPHPGVESATANLTIGPVAAVFDRARDAVAKAVSGG